MRRTYQTIHSGGAFYESPRWHDGRWWVVDMWAGGVFSMAPDGTGVRREVPGPKKPSGLGWRPDGTLMVVSMHDKQIWARRPDGESEVFVDLADMVESPICNEMIVDRSGAAWIGTVDYERPEDVVIRVDTDGSAEIVAGGLRHTNGMVISADGTTMLVAETFGARITAYTIVDGRTLINERTWAELPGMGPDGCSLDGEGHLWVADAYGRRCVRVAEGGEILDEVVPPDDLQVYACMLGGPNGRTLLLSCIPAWILEQPADATHASLVVTDVDVAADPRALP